MSIFSQLPNQLIMRIIRETKSAIHFKEDHEDKFKRCLHDVMYVNYYYNDHGTSCRDNFNDKPTDVLNYNDMINHLREGGDLTDDDDDFNLEEYKENYDKDDEEHKDFMYQLNNDY
tara:strand:- start:390 stop:737 length:348 start_codon:yes stop_codon:yes gene_type:complete